ncbi:MAG: hypothetical protein AAGF58_06445, partial [Pseudomonadota bacterium]
VGSVGLSYTGDHQGRTPATINKLENYDPYTLFGDRNGDFRKGLSMGEGDYSVSYDVYSEDNRGGQKLESDTIAFTVSEPVSAAPAEAPAAPAPAPAPAPAIDPVPVIEPVPERPAAPEGEPSRLKFFIVDVENGPDGDGFFQEITDGGTIDGSQLQGRKVTIYATTEGNDVGSVQLSYSELENGLSIDTISKLENFEPFALFGDRNGDFFGGMSVDGGEFSLRYDVYSEDNRGGQKLESNGLTFTVTEPAPAPAAAAVTEADAPAHVDDPVVAFTPDDDPDDVGFGNQLWERGDSFDFQSVFNQLDQFCQDHPAIVKLAEREDCSAQLHDILSDYFLA